MWLHVISCFIQSCIEKSLTLDITCQFFKTKFDMAITSTSLVNPVISHVYDRGKVFCIWCNGCSIIRPVGSKTWLPPWSTVFQLLAFRAWCLQAKAVATWFVYEYSSLWYALGFALPNHIYGFLFQQNPVSWDVFSVTLTKRKVVMMEITAKESCENMVNFDHLTVCFYCCQRCVII